MLYAWDEHIHGSDGFFIVVEAHVKGLERLRIVVDNHRTLKMLYNTNYHILET